MELSELRKTPHLSASSVGEYVECGLLYKLGRIDRIPMEYKADALEFGTVIHIVLGEFYEAKMVGDKLSLRDVHLSFQNHWHRVAEKRTDIKYAEGKDFNTILMEGTDLLTTWYNKLPSDNFKIIGIEEAFSFNLPDLPIPIIGAMDLIEEDDAGTVIITDFNT